MEREKYSEFAVLVENIARFKEVNHLTFEKMGNELGVNRSHIYRILNMEAYPSFPFLIRLSRYMGVSMSTLFAKVEEE